MGTIRLVTQNCDIPVIVMIRPRPGGFCYNDYEFKTMLSDIEAVMEYDIEGIAFGCLDYKGNIDEVKNYKTIEVINKYHKDAIFHRAFDCVKNPYKSMDILSDLGVKSVIR